MKKPCLHPGNYEKQRIKAAGTHERTADIRKDFLHKLSMRLCNEKQVIVTVSLKVRSIPEEADTKRLPGWIADAPGGSSCICWNTRRKKHILRHRLDAENSPGARTVVRCRPGRR